MGSILCFAPSQGNKTGCIALSQGASLSMRETKRSPSPSPRCVDGQPRAVIARLLRQTKREVVVSQPPKTLWCSQQPRICAVNANKCECASPAHPTTWKLGPNPNVDEEGASCLCARRLLPPSPKRMAANSERCATRRDRAHKRFLCGPQSSGFTPIRGCSSASVELVLSGSV